MAYQGGNLLLREQRRSELDRLRERQQIQDIQDAISVSEDIKNRQFERQRQQAELHGRLAEQLMQKREPFVNEPYEEAAKLGAMSAQSERQKQLEMKARQDELIKGQRGYEGERDIAKHERELELQRLRNQPHYARMRAGSSVGVGDLLKNSINAARLEVQQRKRTMESLSKIDPVTFRKTGTPEEIKQAEQDWLNSYSNLVELSKMADMAKLGLGRESMGEYFQPQLGVSAGQIGGQPSVQPPAQPPGQQPIQQQAPPSIISSPPLEYYEDPILRGIEETKRKEQAQIKLSKAKTEMSRQQQKSLADLESQVKYAMLPKFSEGQIKDLAEQYLAGDDKVKAQIDRIINIAATHPQQKNNPPITLDEWSNALMWMSRQGQGPPGNIPSRQPIESGSMPIEISEDPFLREAKTRGHL